MKKIFSNFCVLWCNFFDLIKWIRANNVFLKNYMHCALLFSDFLDPCKRSPIYISRYLKLWSFFMDNFFQLGFKPSKVCMLKASAFYKHVQKWQLVHLTSTAMLQNFDYLILSDKAFKKVLKTWDNFLNGQLLFLFLRLILWPRR